MNRHMAIDDMAIASLYAKGIKYPVDNPFIVAQLEVIAFLFLECSFVCQEITLESGHLGLVKENAVWATP